MSPHEQADAILEELHRIADPAVQLTVCLQHATAKLHGRFNAQRCAVYLRRKGDAHLTLWAAHGDWAPGISRSSPHPDELVRGPRISRQPGRLAAAIQVGDLPVGVVEVCRSAEAAFTQDEADLLEAVVSGLAGLIRDTPLADCPLVQACQAFERSRQRLAELSVLHEAGRTLSSTLDLSQVLELVPRLAATALLARTAILRLADEDTGEFRVVSRFDADGGAAFAGADAALSEVVRRERAPILVPDLRQDSRFAGQAGSEPAPALCAPLFRQGVLTGSLGLYGKLPRGPGESTRFDQADLRLLVTLGTQAAMTIENARLFHESEQLAQSNLLRLREISILNEIGMAMQGTMHLDALLQVILTGVTFGGGLGFNRAILLLVDESRQWLEGRMAVGPSSGEEAARIWRVLTAQTRSLREVIAERVVQQGESADTALDRLARSLVIPLRPEAGVLALTALEGRPFRITDARNNPRVHPQWEGRLDVDEFACVPLVAKGKVVGVIVVDNKFNRKPITDDDLEFLLVFATQAGLAVESGQVYTRLEEASREIQRSHHQLLQQERLAALGEMAAHVVHEIRNPLVSIGGFARRLTRHLSGREPEGQYAQIIAREVDRLERIVHDVQGMSRQIHLAREETDLHELLQDCLLLFDEKIALQRIDLRMALTGRPPILSLDSVQVKQALLNLLSNALEAMPEGGILTVATRVARTDGRQPVSRSNGESGRGETLGRTGEPTSPPLHKSTGRLAPDEWVEISVGDTGGGIPPEILDEVFDPFFTTKEAGTGLGLSLVRRIARAHGGRVEVDNRPGRGVTFRLWLPAAIIPPEGVAST